ncbi:MAG TPA: hypothetical protein VEL07_21290 [Planctomycetota bacterium]|nr:hypothetical protein [Planctomycetota bacterium]
MADASRPAGRIDKSGMNRCALALSLILVLVVAGCGKRAEEKAAEQKAVEAVNVVETELTGEITEADRKALTKYPKGTEPFRPRWPNGKLRAIGFVCDDKPIGPCAYYDENGRIRTRGTYLYGAVQDGEWQQWFADGGKQSEGSYVRGKEHGEWRYWHRKGGLAMEGSYDRGRKHGMWRSWHENGGKQSAGRFLDDAKAARWQYWNPDGSSAGEVDYLR